MNDFNEEHFMTYYMNHHLATDTGKEIVDSLKKDFPELHQYITTRVEHHNNILKQLAENNGPTGTTGLRD